MTKAGLARDIVKEYIEIGLKNNTSYSKKFISTVLQSRHPDLFKSVEDARDVVRAVLGAAGKRGRTSVMPNLKEDFALMEQPIVECDKAPYIVPKQYKRALVLSDIHSRFYDRQALETAIDYGLKKNADICIINGDLLDFYGQSKFDKNPLILAQFLSERDFAIDLLELLQKYFGKVVYKKGNHDIRRERYIQLKMAEIPEAEGLLSISDYVFFNGSTVDVVEDYNIIEFGKLNILHGHEYYGGGIHVAYTRLNKAMDNILSGHSHVTQTSLKKTIKDEFYGSWTTGCLCDLSPRYNPYNNWTNGFAFVERDDKGEFIVENKQIIKGKVF